MPKSEITDSSRDNRESKLLPERGALPPTAFAAWKPIVALFLGAFLSYAPALSGELIWDDEFLVGNNPFFRSPLFFLEVFRHWLFPDSISAYYRPVQNLSYIADYLVWQGNPFGYHFTNILLHGGAAAFLFLLLQRLLPRFLSGNLSRAPLKSRWIAFCVAAIWVVHPIHNAAVAYIAGRADSLAALLAIGGWWLFLRSEERLGISRIAGFAGAWAAGLLALCSKEIAVTWVVLFLAVELTRTHFAKPGAGKLRSRRLELLGALGFLFICYSVLRHLPVSRASSAAAPELFSARMVLMLRALGDYTRLIFWPADLHMCRAVFTSRAYATLSSWQANIGSEYLSLLGTGTIAAFAFGLRGNLPGYRLRRLGALWFVIGFLPISNLFSLNAQVAEHWIYMPSIGYLLFLAGCCVAIPVKFHKAVAALVAIALMAFAARSWVRSEDWTSQERFYVSTLQSGSRDPRMLMNLSNIYFKRGDSAQAEKMLRSILADRPDFAPASIQLGQVLVAQGRQAEAELLLLRVKKDANPRLYAGTWMADVKLAQTWSTQGRLKEALELISASVDRNPAIDDLIRLKVQLLQQAGRKAESLDLARQRAREAWWNPAAQDELAKLYVKNGEPDAAIEALRSSAWLDVWASEPLALAAGVELSRGKPAAALEFASRAVWRDPKPSQYLLLAGIFQELGRDSEATAAVRHAEQLRGVR